MKTIRFLLLLCLSVISTFHLLAVSAEVRNIEVRNIKLMTSDTLEVFSSFRTAADEPTIQLADGKLSVKIDDVPVTRTDVKLKSFADADQGLAVLIALDISGSMNQSLPGLKLALKKYIQRLRPGKDFVALGIIGDNWRVVLDFTSDIDKASATIDQLQGGSQTTALFESIYEGIKMLSRRGSDLPVRRSMIVLSDGMNEKAGRSAAQCIEIARQNFIDIHSLIFLPTQNSRVLAAKGELEVISRDTGGVTHTALTAEQIGEGVDKLGQEMANEIVMSLPAKAVPTTGLNHTLSVSYDNVSKKVPFVISENELTRIKSLSSPQGEPLKEKIWIYLAAGGVALAILVFVLWRRSVKKRALLLKQQEEARATPPEAPAPPTTVKTDVVQEPAPVPPPARAPVQPASRPASRKTEYRAPTSNQMVSKLVLVQGGARVESFALEGDQIFIGANGSNDICLDVASVSGRHAVITRTSAGLAIADLNSTNGTYVNGNRIQQQAVALVPGQEIRLGLAVFHTE